MKAVALIPPTGLPASALASYFSGTSLVAATALQGQDRLRRVSAGACPAQEL